VNEPFANVLRYNAWATETLLAACLSLSDAQLDAPAIPGASGTIRQLLIHLVTAQETNALRTEGVMRPVLNQDWPGWESLAERARESGVRLVDLAASLDAEVQVEFLEGGKRYLFPKSFFIAAAAEHGDQHRSEIKMALAAMGLPSPDLDGWNWAGATGIGGEA
jgi:uncharacterized damage-inducible protein DinB